MKTDRLWGGLIWVAGWVLGLGLLALIVLGLLDAIVPGFDFFEDSNSGFGVCDPILGDCPPAEDLP